MRSHSICIWSFASSSLLQWPSLSPQARGPSRPGGHTWQFPLDWRQWPGLLSQQWAVHQRRRSLARGVHCCCSCQVLWPAAAARALTSATLRFHARTIGAAPDSTGFPWAFVTKVLVQSGVKDHRDDFINMWCQNHQQGPSGLLCSGGKQIALNPHTRARFEYEKECMEGMGDVNSVYKHRCCD